MDLDQQPWAVIQDAPLRASMRVHEIAGDTMHARAKAKGSEAMPVPVPRAMLTAALVRALLPFCRLCRHQPPLCCLCWSA